MYYNEAPNLNRYEGEEIGDFDYSVFDKTRQGEPVVYRLFLSEIKNRWNNYQIILTVFDASSGPEHEYPQFDRELWSTQMYLDELGKQDICSRILICLQNCEIESPVELCYIFGGTVNNEVPAYPKASLAVASYIC